MRIDARIGVHSHTLGYDSGSIPSIVRKGKVECALHAIPTDAKR